MTHDQRLRMFSGDRFMTSNERHSPPTKNKTNGSKKVPGSLRGLEVECCSFLFSVRETQTKKNFVKFFSYEDT